MRLLVFGRTGQVATEIGRLDPGAIRLGHDEADLRDPEACARAVFSSDVDAVINAAAFTAVDRAEAEEGAATLVNGAAPAAMAWACAARGLPFVHLSTDHVFPGTGDRPWAPSDPTGPVNAYGRSKLAGEEGVRAAGGVHAILRTSWVFSAHGANFARTVARLGDARDSLPVVDDQVGGPTPARNVAGACLHIARALCRGADGGTHHLAGAPPVSRADFAEAILRERGLGCVVERVLTRDHPTPAPRPLNSRLDGASLRAALGIEPPDWRAGLREVALHL